MKKFRSWTRFTLRGLNQEKLLNIMAKQCQLFEIDRSKKNEISFLCPYAHHKKIKTILKDATLAEWQFQHFGPVTMLTNGKKYAGLFVGFAIFVLFYLVQSQFVIRCNVYGNKQVQQCEIVQFVESNFPKRKSKINLEQMQFSLMKRFEQISFCSCIIKGQTLLVSIKEKVVPEEMIGNFAPIVAKYDGRITKIALVSGTVTVKVGDVVKRGDILVQPYTINSAGQKMEVEADAKIEADVYWQGSVDHYDKRIEVVRTGRVFENNQIMLWGLEIYKYEKSKTFEMYETEISINPLSKNIIFPFVLKKTKFYELKEVHIESNFEDVREEYVEKAKTKALEICESCDTIKEEFYTVRHLAGVTIVNYCIITQEEIGEKDVG